MQSQFVKVREQFINMAHVEMVRINENALWLDFNADDESGDAQMFVGQERADILAWLDANSADVTGMSKPKDIEAPKAIPAVAFEINQMLGEKDADIATLRGRLNATETLLRKIQDAQDVSGLRFDGYLELADAIDKISTTIVPF